MTWGSRRQFLAAATGSLAAGRSSDGARAVQVQGRLGTLLWSRLRSRDPASAPNSEPILPAGDAERLYLPLADRLLAVEIATGLPAWPSGQEGDPGDIDRLPAAAAAARGFRGAVLAEGRLLVATGDLTGPELGAISTGAFPELRAYDVATGEGKLAWQQTLTGDLAGRGWMRVSWPVVDGDSVWHLALNHEAGGAFACVELGLADGRIRRLDRLPNEEAPRRGSCAELVIAGGQLFCRLPGGAVLAKSKDDQAVQWSVQASAGPEIEQPAAGGGRLVVGGDGLFVVTASGRVRGLDRASGAWRWEFDPEESNFVLAGIADDQLIGYGQSVWAFDLHSGTPRRRWRLVDAPVAGRVALVAGGAAWSTREELVLVDLATGATLDRQSLRNRWGLVGGDVHWAGDHFVLISEERVSVFGDRGAAARR